MSILEPNYAMALLTMAEAYVAMEEPTAAMDWLEKAVAAVSEVAGEIDTYDCYTPIRGYPRYQKLIGKERTIAVEAEALLAQAKEQFAKKQYQKALAACEQVLAITPDWPEALLYCGLSKYKLAGNTGWVTELLLKSGGLDDLAKALEYEPSLEESLKAVEPLSKELLADALNERACDYIANEQYKEAFRDIKQALRLNPAYTMAHLTMAEYYVVWNKHEEAMDWLEKAVALDGKLVSKIDTYDCFRPLRFNERYQQLTGGAPASDKSFYVLEMFVEPGGMREHIRFASGNLQHIEQVLTSNIKGEWGFYKLISYGQNIMLHRFENGRKVASVNLLPYIRLYVPGHFTAVFSLAGKAELLDMDGKVLKDSWEETVTKKHKRTGAAYEVKEVKTRAAYLSDLLWEYRAESEAEETLFLAPFAEKIGALSGQALAEGEQAETAEAIFVGEQFVELESGYECTLAEYLAIIHA